MVEIDRHGLNEAIARLWQSFVVDDDDVEFTAAVNTAITRIETALEGVT